MAVCGRRVCACVLVVITKYLVYNYFFVYLFYLLQHFTVLKRLLLRGLNVVLAAIAPTLFIILWGLEIAPTPTRFLKIAGIALFFFTEVKKEKYFLRA